MLIIIQAMSKCSKSISYPEALEVLEKDFRNRIYIRLVHSTFDGVEYKVKVFSSPKKVREFVVLWSPSIVRVTLFEFDDRCWTLVDLSTVFEMFVQKSCF